MFQHFIITLPASVCLMFSILLLTKKEQYPKSKRIMALNLMLYAIVFFCYGYYYKHDYTFYYYIHIIYTLAVLFCFPTTIYYINILVFNKMSKIKATITFIPPILYSIYVIILYIALDESESIIFVKNVLYGFHIEHVQSSTYNTLMLLNHTAFNYLLFSLIIWFSIESFIHIPKYNKQLSNYYSNVGDVEKNFFITWGIIFFCTLLIIHALTVWQKELPIDIASIFFLIYATILFLIGRSIYTLKYSAANFINYIEKKKEAHQCSIEMNQDGTFSSKILCQINEQLLGLMTSKEIFLKPNLSLYDIAETLKTNRSYISEIINTGHNKSFSEFINEYRINYAKELITQNTGYSLDYIAEQAGFMSYTSFYRSFKQIAGLSPKQWINSINT